VADGRLRPIVGRAHAFLQFNPNKALFAEQMFAKQAQRLYGVLDTYWGKVDFATGDYSRAAIAIFPWAARHQWQCVNLISFPNVLRW
jgi:GST-like protein